MSKFKTEFHWIRGSKVNWMGYKLTGVWGKYSFQARHHWFGIYGIIGFRYSKMWGASL